MKKVNELTQEIRHGNVVVNCITEASAKNFIKTCHENGITFSKGTPKNETYYYAFKERTCYQLKNNTITYGNIECFQFCKIIQWKTSIFKSVNRNTIDLEKIKNKQIKVACKTEELARDFIDFCYKNNYSWVCSDKERTHYDIYEEHTYYTIKNDKLLFGELEIYPLDCKEEILEWEIIEEPSAKIDDKGITFKGVIKIIQDREIWKSNRREITILNGDIIIERTNNDIGKGMFISDEEKFFKIGIPFEKAFLELKNGKAIRSLVTKCEFILKNGRIIFKNDETHFPRTIVSKELLGMWEIVQ